MGSSLIGKEEHWRLTSLGDEPVYCAAPDDIDDILCYGSDNVLDDGPRLARRQRYEEMGSRYLNGQIPRLLSASLRGPFDAASGWENPWLHKDSRFEGQHIAVNNGRPASNAWPAVKAIVRMEPERKAESERTTSCMRGSIQRQVLNPDNHRDRVQPIHSHRDPQMHSRIQEWATNVPVDLLGRDEFWAPESGSADVSDAGSSGYKRKAPRKEWLKSRLNKRRKTDVASAPPLSAPVPGTISKAVSRTASAPTARDQTNSSSSTFKPLNHLSHMTTPGSGVGDGSGESYDAHSAIVTDEPVDISALQTRSLSEPIAGALNQIIRTDASAGHPSLTISTETNDGLLMGSSRTADDNTALSPLARTRETAMGHDDSVNVGPTTEGPDDQSVRQTTNEDSTRNFGLKVGFESHADLSFQYRARVVKPAVYKSLSEPKNSALLLSQQTQTATPESEHHCDSIDVQIDVFQAEAGRGDDEPDEINAVASRIDTESNLQPVEDGATLLIDPPAPKITDSEMQNPDLQRAVQNRDITSSPQHDSVENDLDTSLPDQVRIPSYDERKDRQDGGGAAEETEQQQFDLPVMTYEKQGPSGDDVATDTDDHTAASRLTQSVSPYVAEERSPSEPLVHERSTLIGDPMDLGSRIQTYMSPPLETPEMGQIPSTATSLAELAEQAYSILVSQQGPSNEVAILQESTQQNLGDDDKNQDEVTARSRVLIPHSQVEWDTTNSPVILPVILTEDHSGAAQTSLPKFGQMSQSGGVMDRSPRAEDTENQSPWAQEHVSETNIQEDMRLPCLNTNSVSDLDHDMIERQRSPLQLNPWTIGDTEMQRLSHEQLLPEHSQTPTVEPPSATSHQHRSSPALIPSPQSQKLPFFNAQLDMTPRTSGDNRLSAAEILLTTTYQSGTPAANGLRSSTPEAELSIKSFAKFNTPSPKKNRRLPRLASGRFPSTQILVNATSTNPWSSETRSRSTNRRVSFAPLPGQGGTDGMNHTYGEPSIIGASTRATSPPPDCTSIESVNGDVDDRFRGHFDAVRWRSSITPQFRIQSRLLPRDSQQMTLSPDVRAMAEAFMEADRHQQGLPSASSPIAFSEERLHTQTPTSTSNTCAENRDQTIELEEELLAIHQSPWRPDSQGVDDVAAVLQNLDDFLNPRWEVNAEADKAKASMEGLENQGAGQTTLGESALEHRIWNNAF